MTVVRCIFVVLLLGPGCGRLGFDQLSNDVTGDGGADGDSGTVDAVGPGGDGGPGNDGGPSPDGGSGGLAENFALRQTCQSWWTFDAPTPVQDHCGVYNLTEFNPATYSPTVPPNSGGNSLKLLDGANASSVDYVSLYVDASFSPILGGNDLTIGCWIRPNAAALGDFANILRNRTGSTGFWLVGSNGIINVRLDGSSYSADTAMSADTWQHVVVRYNDLTAGGDVDATTANDEIAIFVNGQKDCAGGVCQTGDNALTANANPFGIGSLVFGGAGWDVFDGFIDECFVVSSSVAGQGGALSDQEICEICRCGFGGDVADRGAQCGNCEMSAGVACPGGGG